MFSCAGQVALITGGGTGIGFACTEALARAGARVVIIGLNDAPSSAQELSDQGFAALGIECDVTDSVALRAAVAQTLESFGRIDTVLANAGVALDDPASGDQLDRLDRMYEINVRSVVELSELTLPFMAAVGGGTFLVMSSLSGLRGNKIIAGYGVTKAANAQIARNIAVQWGPAGIRANTLSPGVIETEFAKPITADSKLATARLAKTPLGRFGQPYEVAGAVVWLASPAGAFVSGQNIVIDGGTLTSD